MSMQKPHAIDPPSCRGLVFSRFIGEGYFSVTIAVVVLSVIHSSQTIGRNSDAAMITPNGLRIERSGRLRFETFHSRPPCGTNFRYAVHHGMAPGQKWSG